MSTIEELLDTRSRAVVAFHKLDDLLPLNEWTAEQGKEWDRLDEATATTAAAIVDPWNAALAAMRATQPTLYGMLCERWGHPDDWPKEAQGRTVYEQLKAALALMEGDSPSRDESMADDTHPEHELDDEYYERVVKDYHHSAMLEDKRYERDEIYKK